MRKEDSMIVKVKTDFFLGCKERRALIYNEDHSFYWEGVATKEITNAMRGKGILSRVFGKFFHAHLGEDGKICLDEEVPRQDW